MIPIRKNSPDHTLFISGINQLLPNQLFFQEKVHHKMEASVIYNTRYQIPRKNKDHHHYTFCILRGGRHYHIADWD